LRTPFALIIAPALRISGGKPAFPTMRLLKEVLNYRRELLDQKLGVNQTLLMVGKGACPRCASADEEQLDGKVFELTHSPPVGFDRSRLICDRRAFASSVRFLALRGTRVGTRLGCL